MSSTSSTSPNTRNVTPNTSEKKADTVSKPPSPPAISFPTSVPA